MFKTLKNSKKSPKKSHHTPLLSLWALLTYTLTASKKALHSSLHSALNSLPSPLSVLHSALNSLHSITTSLHSIASSISSTYQRTIPYLLTPTKAFLTSCLNELTSFLSLLTSLISFILTSILSIPVFIFILAYYILKTALHLITSIFKFLSTHTHQLLTLILILLLLLTLTLIPILSHHIHSFTPTSEELPPVQDHPDYEINSAGIKISQLDGFMSALISLTGLPEYKYIIPIKVSAISNPLQANITYSSLDKLISEGHLLFVENIVLDYMKELRVQLNSLGFSSYDLTLTVESQNNDTLVYFLINEQGGEYTIEEFL